MFMVNENSENANPRKLGMFATRDVSEDEWSRDSGVADMEDADLEVLPTTFSGDEESSEILQELERDMDRMDRIRIQEGSFRKTSMPQEISRGLSDITNSARLESPKSRNLFRVPHKKSLPRKRTMVELTSIDKRARAATIDENQEGCSRVAFSQFMPEVSVKFDMKLTRTCSSSALQPGPNYRNPEILPPEHVEVNYQLSYLPTDDSQAFRRISAETLRELVKDEEKFLDRFLLIDCRYPYEYRAGHIKHAINMYDPTKCPNLFYPADGQEKRKMMRKIPIFYCEYSQKRGPFMAHTLRRHDRTVNKESYPFVDYQEMYVLDRGFKGFYETHSDPAFQSIFNGHNYLPMIDQRYRQELSKFNFHKHGVGATTCGRALSSRCRQMMRQKSSECSPSSRKMLFRQLSVSSDVVTDNSTPTRPLPAPAFS